ncbi:MAG: hypothetical protein ACRDGI_11325 [Candidatus Limnocylindrales bacterium]
MSAGLLALALASMTLPTVTRHGLWLPIHLGLAGAAGTAVASALPFFAAALAVVAPANRTVRIGAIVLIAGGSVTAAVGVVSDASGLSAVGGLGYLSGLGLTAAAVFGSVRGSPRLRHPLLVAAYGAGLVQVVIGVGFVTAMLVGNRLIVEHWDRFMPAHAWLNVFGFLSVIVAATLVHFAPTVAGGRIVPRPSAMIAVGSLAAAPPLVALGLIASSAALARLGGLIEALGAIALVVHAITVQRAHGRWTTDPEWHRLTAGSLLAGPIWLCVVAVVDAGRILWLGADPAAWSLEIIVVPLALGWFAQVLVGAWTHLLPAIGPGDLATHARQRILLGRRATARLVGLNFGVALAVAGTIIQPPALEVAGIVLAAGSVLVSIGIFIGAAALEKRARLLS